MSSNGVGTPRTIIRVKVCASNNIETESIMFLDGSGQGFEKFEHALPGNQIAGHQGPYRSEIVLRAGVIGRQRWFYSDDAPPYPCERINWLLN